MSSGAEVRAAIERGIAFIEGRQLPTGEIPVCTAKGRLMSGACTEDPSVFPTAIMAHSLSFAPRAHNVRERALDFLLREMQPDGFWKHWTRAHPHFHQLPPDLDDTSAASAVLLRSGRSFPDQKRQLLKNRNRRGLFRTWRLSSAELRHPLALYFFFRKTSADPFDVDAVVNANVIFYLGAIPETAAAIDHLVAVLRANHESSCDKWYENPFAVWYFFSRALHPWSREAGEIIRTRLAAASPATVLDEALAACSALYWNDVPAIDSLLDAQNESGGWPRAGLYHGGRRRLAEWAFAEPHPDTPWWGSEELTTAFCVEALSRWLEVTQQ